MTEERSIAQRLFDARDAEIQLEEQLSEAGVPFERLGWDWYDCSLEIHDVGPEYRLSEAAQRICHAAGFAKVYVNHSDNWETHYRYNPTGEFQMSDGWRVSYPHKRNEQPGSGILVEKQVESWPKEWFESGYAKVIA